MDHSSDLHRKPSVADTFVADRAMFWGRFTSFTKGAVIVVVVILAGMWVFLT